MTIYIDSDFLCHTTDGDGRRAFDVEFFDGKCAAFIEGYRYVPSGETWTRQDGVEFSGEMISAATDYSRLAAAQGGYDERDATAVEEMAAVIEDVYNEDLASIEE